MKWAVKLEGIRTFLSPIIAEDIAKRMRCEWESVDVLSVEAKGVMEVYIIAVRAHGDDLTQPPRLLRIDGTIDGGRDER